MKAKHCEIILYVDDGWDMNRIVDAIADRKTVKLYACILHDKDIDENGAVKKPHFHLYLNFGNNSTDFKYIAKWFKTSENMVSRIKTNRQAVFVYMIHGNAPDKASYSISDIHANFDVEKEIELAQSRSNSWKTILDGCADGTITMENYSDFVSSSQYINLESKMERAWTWFKHAENKRTNSHRNCCVIWLSGASGVGKTTLVSLLSEQMGESLYITASGKDPFSDYNEQSIILLDDIRPGTPFAFAEFLKIIDPHYSSPIASRYHNKIPRAKIIAITTVQTPKQFYAGYRLSDEDTYFQLLRRLNYVLNVSEQEIEIFGDYKDGHHTLLSVIENPVPAYLKKINAQHTNSIDLFSVLSDINKKYTNQTNISQQSDFTDSIEQGEQVKNNNK